MTAESGQPAGLSREAGSEERAELERLRTLLEHSLEVISLLDASGCILYRSPAKVRPLGYADGLVGRNALEIVHEGDRARIGQKLVELVKQPGGVASDVFRVHHADGSVRWMEATTTNLLHDAKVGGIVVTYRDVTAQRHAEEEAQRAANLASAASLAAALGHEVGNPLTALTLNLEAALRELPNQDRNELEQSLSTALESARRIAAIATGLRVLVQGSGDTLERADLRVVLDRARAHVSYIAGPSIRVFEPAAPLYVLGEESKLVTVFSNLFANALEAHPFAPGDDEIVARVALDGDRISIEVKDRGVGIDEEHLSKVCEPFFTTKREQGRSGLGLAVVQRTVEQLGGSLSIESSPGTGTSARVWLKRVDPPALMSVMPDAEMSKNVRGRLLVVDDDPLVLRSLTKLLKLDHDAVPARSGEEALQRIRSGENFDAIVCDVLMPGMNGIELLAELERIDARLAETVIFITGGGSGEIEDFLRRAGRPFMNKPPDSVRLRLMVTERVMRSRRRRRK